MLRAAGDITQDDVLVVVGSRAILGQLPDAPAEMCISIEAGLYPRHRPERADLIDGTIGELSPFLRTFGYYARGIGPETAILPAGWEERLVVIENANTRGIRGSCIEVHDLVIAKLVAGREHPPRRASPLSWRTAPPPTVAQRTGSWSVRRSGPSGICVAQH